MMNSYELQYTLIGHLAGVLIFELYGFGRDSLIETGKCPTQTETNAYAAYQLISEQTWFPFFVKLGFFGSFGVTLYRLFARKHRSSFDIVNLTQHILFAATLLRSAYTLREVQKAGEFPSDVFQCKTVMLMASANIGQLGIQTLTMLLLNYFAYDEIQKNFNKDRKRALILYSLNYFLIGFISGYYTVFNMLFDRLAMFPVRCR